MLRYYSGRLEEALLHLFPEIGLDRGKLNTGRHFPTDLFNIFMII